MAKSSALFNNGNASCTCGQSSCHMGERTPGSRISEATLHFLEFRAGRICLDLILIKTYIVGRKGWLGGAPARGFRCRCACCPPGGRTSKTEIRNWKLENRELRHGCRVLGVGTET